MSILGALCESINEDSRIVTLCRLLPSKHYKHDVRLYVVPQVPTYDPAQLQRILDGIAPEIKPVDHVPFAQAEDHLVIGRNFYVDTWGEQIVTERTKIKISESDLIDIPWLEPLPQETVTTCRTPYRVGILLAVYPDSEFAARASSFQLPDPYLIPIRDVPQLLNSYKM
jgi:hypothetical protein